MDQISSDAVQQQFYIPATSALMWRPRTLKHNDTFALFDDYGDLPGTNPEGLYHCDTRHLSVLRLEIEGRKPLLLSSTIQDNNAVLTADLTNPDIYSGERLTLPHDSVHVVRSKFLWAGACYEAIVVHNYSAQAQTLEASLTFAADFRDIFEVRGHVRPRRGQIESPVLGRQRVMLRYTGLDERVRHTELAFSPPPDELDGSRAVWRLELESGARAELFVTAACSAQEQADTRFIAKLRHASRARRKAARERVEVRTSNQLFNEFLSRSLADLDMLVTHTPHGPYPYAGIPWFATAFGRDAIITALEVLAFEPALAKGVLEFLAAHQAHDLDPSRDAEPGKILHEMRQGEMAELGEIPFGRYYGSIDSTPLFALLAGLYWERTGDLQTIKRLWPNICAALEWIDRYGDCDGDGFVEYLRKSANGLENQGWKDSGDSIFHADGTLASGSIALCEVQAYVYAAKSHAARIAAALGEDGFANRLREEAAELKWHFEQKFWLPERDYYALALDGKKRPCAVLTSNAGHALYCGIASADRAAKVAQRLASTELFSGWGIRTVGAAEARFNPLSYHNGSVWPHDNALVAVGLARYGHIEQALKVMTGLFDASKYMSLRRLPELFCGIRRKPGRGPTFYPVACSPQAWASGAPFALLNAAFGLQFDLAAEKVRFVRPRLPDFLEEVQLGNLRIGTSTLDIALHRRGHSVAVTVLNKTGPVMVEVVLTSSASGRR